MLTRRKLLTHAIAVPAAFALARPAFAAPSPIFLKDGVAIGGTDPVGYFTDGSPVAGLVENSLDWRGATWHFATPENRAKFEMQPEVYAPRYGGYCAWAVALGSLAPTIPEAWAIYEGALYLNASRRIQRRWERDIPGFIEQADANWPSLIA